MANSKKSPAVDLIYEPVDDDSEVYYPDQSANRSRKSAEIAKKDEMADLRNCNLSDFFGANGAIAGLLEGYETRPSQVEMAEAIKQAILDGRHALVEAPTGTGKSIAYLIPAILSGKTVVVATANKSLQSQLFQKDIPFLRKVMNREISAVLVKGRSNFVCNYKWENESLTQQQFAMYDKANDQIQPIKLWLDETDTGDVDDLPFMLESDLRPRIVSFPDDCLHDECVHWDDNCWVNLMRDKAASAQILITNHHLLLNALELKMAGERILPPAAIYIIDEAHGLEQTATSVYETMVSDYTVEQLLQRTVFKQHVDEDEIDELRYHNTLAFQELSHLSRDNAFRVGSDLEEMKKLSSALEKLGKRLKETNPYKEKTAEDAQPAAINEKLAPARKSKEASDAKTNSLASNNDESGAARKFYELAVEQLNSTATKLAAIASSKRDGEMVRYASRVFDRRHITIEVHAAPINPAALLTEYLFHPEPVYDEPVERTVICTSATLATNREFVHFKARCGIQSECTERVLASVFDYPRQAMLYQPPLAAFDYRNSDAFYAAAGAEVRRLLEVSRGRSLCLFTSWSGLQQVNDILKAKGSEPIWSIRAQGDAPRDALLTWFKDTPYSVLLATRSFWEGVDIPGDDLSLVIVDKMPFPTPGDPLHSARMKAIDDAGRSSFGEYMVPLMTLALKQGFGRLIRRGTDNGVVAILDERLSSKGYGRQTRNDLPPARFSRDFKDVHKFYQQSLNTTAEFALNVWGVSAQSSGQTLRAKLEADLGISTPDSKSAPKPMWRWQLLRLSDGKADEKEGEAADLPDTIAGELFAAIEGLSDLRQRIERAGRSPKQFAVEIRCSATMQSAAETGQPYRELARRFATECGAWSQIGFVIVS